MTVWQNKIFRGCLAGKPYPRDTRENQLSLSCPNSSHFSHVQDTCITLSCPDFSHSSHVQGTCITSQDAYSRATHENTSIFNALSLHTLSLSHTQPLQINLTWNTGYKRLNKVTIKFGTELKPTKHIVVNYNYIIFELLNESWDW